MFRYVVITSRYQASLSDILVCF